MRNNASLQLYESLKELHDLLEENLPAWYLKKHHINALVSMQYYKDTFKCDNEHCDEGKIELPNGFINCSLCEQIR